MCAIYTQILKLTNNNITDVPLTTRLVKLIESGVVNRYINEYSSNATVCLRAPGREGGTKTLSFALEDLRGIFLLLVGGEEQ